MAATHRLRRTVPRRDANGKRLAEYQIWANMKQRCENSRNCNYRYYGALGVMVCERWSGSYENFIADMGPRPSPEHSIDRYPNGKGNYEPSNCRWATKAEQAASRGSTVLVEYLGELIPLKWAAQRAGISYETVVSRVQKGWSHERALTTPVDVSHSRAGSVAHV